MVVRFFALVAVIAGLVSLVVPWWDLGTELAVTLGGIAGLVQPWTEDSFRRR